MVFLYIVVDNIIRQAVYDISIWGFSPEKSLKTIKISEKKAIRITELINFIEITLEEQDIKDLIILGNREYISKLLDDKLENHSHIRIKLNEETGYSVKFVAGINSGKKSYRLLDTSSFGINRTIEKLMK